MKYKLDLEASFKLLVVAMIAIGGLTFAADAQTENDCQTTACRQDLAAARAATAAYHDLESAKSDDFVPVFDCFALPEGPAMGFHYVNPERASDGVLDASQPELLIYLPNSFGKMDLVAVEYLLPGDPGDTPPVLYGRQLEYTPLVASWTLHAWIWRNNPDGMFADFNPSLRCPAT